MHGHKYTYKTNSDVSVCVLFSLTAKTSHYISNIFLDLYDINNTCFAEVSKLKWSLSNTYECICKANLGLTDIMSLWSDYVD